MSKLSTPEKEGGEVRGQRVSENNDISLINQLKVSGYDFNKDNLRIVTKANRQQISKLINDRSFPESSKQYLVLIFSEVFCFIYFF